MTDIIMTYVQFDGENEPEDLAGVDGQINVDFLIPEIYRSYNSETLNEPFIQAFAKHKTHPREFSIIHKIFNPDYDPDVYPEGPPIDQVKETLFTPAEATVQISQLIEIFKDAGRYDDVKKDFDAIQDLCRKAEKANGLVQSFYY